MVKSLRYTEYVPSTKLPVATNVQAPQDASTDRATRIHNGAKEVEGCHIGPNPRRKRNEGNAQKSGRGGRSVGVGIAPRCSEHCGGSIGARIDGTIGPLGRLNLEAQNAPILKAFQAKTGIKISTLIFSPITGYSDTLTKWATGTRPDLLQWFVSATDVAVLNPTQTLVPSRTCRSSKRPPPPSWTTRCDMTAKIWAAMLDTPILDTVSYNKPIFAKLNLSAPKNFNQLVALCQTIKQKDPSVAPIAGGFGDLWPNADPSVRDVELVLANQLRPHHGWHQ